MKHLFLFLSFVLLFNLIVKSQEYFQFPTKDVNWNVYLISSCDESSPDTILLRYTIHGDTTINENLYHKLCLECGDTSNPVINPIGGLRENDKKVYFIGKDFLGYEYYEEVLLYDFSKQIGDTIKHSSDGIFYSVIEDIDSIIIDGMYRKRFQVNNHWFYHNPDYIIEGIGSVQNGLLGHITMIPTCGYHYWEHICFREEGIIKYLNPSFEDCFPSNLIVSLNRIELKKDVRIFPNPTSGQLSVENNTINQILIVKIIDVNGKILIQESLTTKKASIKMPNISGFFEVIITDIDGRILDSEKIIKK
jgi:hypothetical protein